MSLAERDGKRLPGAPLLTVGSLRADLWFMPQQPVKIDPAMPEDPPNNTMTVPTAPERSLTDKTNNNEPLVSVVTIPLVTEGQLTAATGGAELSCYRCTVPFGLVVLIAGIVVTAVAYSFNSHGSTISYFGLVLLSAGLGLLGLSAVCWKVRLERKKERRRESQTALVTNHRSIFA